jgi:hypothetical protein
MSRQKQKKASGRCCCLGASGPDDQDLFTNGSEEQGAQGLAQRDARRSASAQAECPSVATEAVGAEAQQSDKHSRTASSGQGLCPKGGTISCCTARRGCVLEFSPITMLLACAAGQIFPAAGSTGVI